MKLVTTHKSFVEHQLGTPETPPSRFNRALSPSGSGGTLSSGRPTPLQVSRFAQESMRSPVMTDT